MVFTCRQRRLIWSLIRNTLVDLWYAGVDSIYAQHFLLYYWIWSLVKNLVHWAKPKGTRFFNVSWQSWMPHLWLSVNAPVIERSRNEPYADVDTIYAKLLFLFLKIHSNRYNHVPQNCLSKADTFSCIIKTLLCNNQYKEKDIGIRLGVQAKQNPKQ